MFRLFRIAKIYKSVNQTDIFENTNRKKFRSVTPITIDSKFGSNSQSNLMFSTENNEKGEKGEKKNLAQKVQEKEVPESRVGKKMSENTTKRVIILVLLLLLVIPLFSSEYYFDPDESFIFGLKILSEISNNFNNSTLTQTSYDNYVSQHINAYYPLIYLKMPSINQAYQTSQNYLDLRNDEFSRQTFSLNGYANAESVVDLRNKTKVIAGINIGRTIYICLVLSIGALMFSKDANDLALRPIEKMIEKVNEIARNPLSSKTFELIENNGNRLYETVTIYNAIIKIGMLLALGFGEAGIILNIRTILIN